MPKARLLIALVSSGILLTAGGADAGHLAGGTCPHTHFDQAHSECNAGVPGATCSVGATAGGTCQQTSSSCLCKLPNQHVQEFVLQALEELSGSMLMLQVLVAKLPAPLGAQVGSIQINELLTLMSKATLTLQALGPVGDPDPSLLSVIDGILARLPGFLSVVSDLAPERTGDVINLGQVLIAKKSEIVANLPALLAP